MCLMRLRGLHKEFALFQKADVIVKENVEMERQSPWIMAARISCPSQILDVPLIEDAANEQGLQVLLLQPGHKHIRFLAVK